MKFQSHYGAIATRPTRPLGAGTNSCFNPTMVRLRLMKIFLKFLFQSHYGAIATDIDRLARKPCPCFNPTMVRLRPSRPARKRAVFRGFNPTMVRLRLAKGHQKASATKFQSHYGAIATCFKPDADVVNAPVSIPLWCDCDGNSLKLGCSTIPRFNPTMVRLRL